MALNAKESRQVQKVRKKLEKVLEEEQKRINKDTLQEMSKTIQNWIWRHQSERINLQEKTFKLFNENASPAETKSKFVHHLLNQLKKEEGKVREEGGLKGRVTRSEEATQISAELPEPNEDNE
jgi:hypothetical protein